MRTSARGVAGAALAVAVGLGALTGCSDDPGGTGEGEAGASPSPEVVPFPGDLVAYVDQSRIDRQGREAVIRLVDEGDHTVEVTRAEIRSPRWGEVVWTGEESFVNEVDLEFEMPVARCGEGSDAEVTLTYAVDGGPVVESTTTATDRYGAIDLFLERDCAEETFLEAASLRLGRVRIVGEGLRSVLELPMTMTPIGRAETGDRVAFAGFEDTVLFRQAPGSASVLAGTDVPLGAGAPPARVLLRLVPARCDPHALGEDKVGTLVGVRVRAPGLSETAAFYLPIGDERRAQLRRFFSTHCGYL